MANYTCEYEDGDYVFKANGLQMGRETIIRMMTECDRLAEQMNNISDAVLGYREGGVIDMIERITHLKMKAENVEIDNRARELADKIEELNDLLQDIKADA